MALSKNPNRHHCSDGTPKTKALKFNNTEQDKCEYCNEMPSICADCYDKHILEVAHRDTVEAGLMRLGQSTNWFVLWKWFPVGAHGGSLRIVHIPRTAVTEHKECGWHDTPGEAVRKALEENDET